MQLSAGTRIGPYEIVGPLGAGGMGEVYRAHDARLGRDVAVKVLPPEFAHDPERMARFRREAQTLAALTHANIAAIYGIEEAGDTPHLVLELVEGETLAARLRRGPLPPREALLLGIQLAAAMSAAHERGVVHRDLKPGNLMLTESGTLKVLDFGLAKSDPRPVIDSGLTNTPTVTAFGGATLPGVLVGTAAYMSPEQARGLPMDRRSDVWSFGCVLFESFAGLPPFAGSTVTDLLARILEREPDWSSLPAGVPPRVREILKRCLRKEASERPRDLRDVGLELEQVAAGGDRGDSAREKSIAVLPFENQGGADDEYFADGMTDEILNALGHVEGLRVAARTSCFTFKGRREDLRLVGEKLDVANVLEGSVRRSGAQLRITVRLANAADGYQLWSERYDRDTTDVFAVQDEIAEAIATRLRGAIDGGHRTMQRGGTRNLEAYELMLRGRALQDKRGRFMGQAVACFERAIELDSEYAEALAALSDSYRLMAVFGIGPARQFMDRARELAERALRHDPGQSQAWMTLAAVYEQFDHQYDEGARCYDRAVEADPRNARPRVQRALWALICGRCTEDEACNGAAQSVRFDPLSAWIGGMHSYILGISGRHAASVAEAERALAIDGDSFFAHWNLVRAKAWAGRYDDAIADAPALFEASGRQQWALGLLAWTYGAADHAAQARACFDELEGRSRHEFVSPSWLGIAAGSAGLRDVAIRSLSEAVAERDPIVLWAHRLPFWNVLRGDPRFEAIIRELR